MLDIDKLIADWLDAGKPVSASAPLPFGEKHKWNPDTLHVTDLSACPRQVCYRAVLHADARKDGPVQKAMFDIANYQHWVVCRALEHANMLIEEEVSIDLPDGWGGRLDYVRLTDDGNERTGDVKTSHPNWIKYVNDYPKPEHRLQVSTYVAFHPTTDPLVEVCYKDRGGSNPSMVCEMEPYPKEYVKDKMYALEQAATDCNLDGTLPPVLEPSIQWGRKNYDKNGNPTGGAIMYACDWRCRYCRYDQCPASRESYRIAQQTKTRGIEMGANYKHLEDAVMAFLEQDGVLA